MEYSSSPSASTSPTPPKLCEPSNVKVVAKGSPGSVEIPVRSEQEHEMVEEGKGSPQKEAFARRRSLRGIRKGTVQERRRLFEASTTAPPVVDGQQTLINKRKRHCPPTTSKAEISGPIENKKARVTEQVEAKIHSSIIDTKSQLSESKGGTETKDDVDKREDKDLSNDTVTRKVESGAVAVSTTQVATNAGSTTNKVRAEIKQLEKQVVVQDKIINQVSKALNICVSNLEFYNSTEYVESERVLLLATQKRRALIHQIKRLKSNPISDYSSYPLPPKNILTISNIILPTKSDFTTRKLRGSEIYNYVCLIKAEDQIESTKFVAISSKETTKEIKFGSVVTLKNLPSNGQIKIEVYGLETIKESLPFDLKYHIKPKDKPSGKLTPVKLDKKSGPVLSPSVCSLTMSFHSSPSDPVPICSPKFVLCGSLIVDIMGEEKRCGVLEGSKTDCPLVGSISFDIKITTN